MRRTISLNHDWEFIPEFKKEFINQNQLIDAKKVMIPHTMLETPLNYFDELDYQFIGTYNKLFQIDEDMLGKTLIIRFDGVMNTAKVYLNGEMETIHEGGYTPFSVDISEKAKAGENLLQVIVDSTESQEIPPHGHLVDYLSFSGIYREVSLDVLPKTHINKLHVYSDETAYLHEDEMMLGLNLGIKQDKEKEYKVHCTLIHEEKEVFEHSFETSIINKTDYAAQVSGIKRWTLEEPNLYTIKVDILDGKEIIDTAYARFGFRTVNFTTEGFFLNNEHIKLIGLNRHQSYPYVGYAMPKRMQESDAELLKEFGANIVRTSHYMQSEHFLNRCDELGLLVFEEIPGWNFIGEDHFKELTYQNLEVMINTHFNHPSIISWGVRINESKDDHDFYEKTNQIARNLDSTRPTGGVRNLKKSEFLEDVYTYNDFFHNGYNLGLENPRKVTPGYIPYLVTEHNGHMFPTKKYDTEERRLEQALRHARVIDAAYRYKRISGAIGWCMADYNTHIQFGSNDRICHHGVMDMFRIPKYASYVYQAENSGEPMLHIANNLIPGDHDEMKIPEIVAFTNCDYIKMYKNDQLVGEFEPDWDGFPYMNHPPVFINDFIGDLLVENEDYKPKLARKITRLLRSYSFYGFKMPLKDKIQFAWLYIRKVMPMEDVVRLYEDYIAFQKEKPVVFRFEGYIEDELVCTETRANTVKTKLIVKQDSEELVHGFTYDVGRVVIRLVDDYGNDLIYSNESFTVETSEHLEVIGPKNQALIGGSIAIYLKTTGKTGTASIKIKPNNYPEMTLNFTVIK